MISGYNCASLPTFYAANARATSFFPPLKMAPGGAGADVAHTQNPRPAYAHTTCGGGIRY